MYLGVGYELFQWRALHVGAALVALTGYTEGQVEWVLAPVASLEFEKFGVNLVPVTPAIIGLQLKWKF